MTARAAKLASVWCVAVAAGAPAFAPAQAPAFAPAQAPAFAPVQAPAFAPVQFAPVQAPAFAFPAAPTFTRDVAPVLYAHCAVCHRDGGPAPFSLVTYAEVRPWARAIRQATAARTMPPWKPAPGHGGPFAGERRMREGEIALLDRWVEQGATEGDPDDLDPPPVWTSAWELGPPDLVLALPEPYELAAGGEDEYRNFVLPVPLATTRFVRAFDFRPAGRAIHHARLLIDPARTARRLDRRDPAPGYDDALDDDATFPDGHLLAWAPGRVPAFEPEALAWRLDPGVDLVLQLHLPASEVPERIAPRVGLYFADAPPIGAPTAVLLGDKTIDIPAGAARHVIEDTLRLPVEVEVLSVYPHAHYLGRDLQGFATLPDGSRRWLVRIDDWDFNWQDEYRLAEPLFLPAGTTLSMRYVYDNSAANRRNPSHPPRRVRYGRRSTDEMAELVVKVRTGTPAERERLSRVLTRKANAVDMAGAEKRARDDPRDFRAHHELGIYYLEAGRVAEAADRFRRVLGLNPGFAPAHYNLGIIEGGTGALDAAAARFEAALAHDPAHVGALTNYGILLHALGRPGEAVRRYRTAISIEPDLAETHNNLAVALLALGRAAEAAQAAEQAARLTGWKDAQAIETLAAARAAAGASGQSPE